MKRVNPTTGVLETREGWMIVPRWVPVEDNQQIARLQKPVPRHMSQMPEIYTPASAREAMQK